MEKRSPRNEYLDPIDVPKHPLADGHGRQRPHRLALWNKYGPGPHPCNWCRTVGDYKDSDPNRRLETDHLDGNRRNNRHSNLVDSCHSCNVLRALAGNPPEWNPILERARERARDAEWEAYFEAEAQEAFFEAELDPERIREAEDRALQARLEVEWEEFLAGSDGSPIPYGSRARDTHPEDGEDFDFDRLVEESVSAVRSAVRSTCVSLLDLLVDGLERPGWISPFPVVEEARSRPWAVWLEPFSADARSPPAGPIRPETMPSRPAPL